jgi:hypothetical protein
MNRITQKDIVEEVETLRKLTGNTRLHADFAACYGGWRLDDVDPITHSRCGALGMSDICARLSTREFWQLLKGIEIGLTHVRV